MNEELLRKRLMARVQRVEIYGLFLSYDGKEIIVLIPDVSRKKIPDLRAVYKIGDSARVEILEYLNDRRMYKGRIVNSDMETDFEIFEESERQIKVSPNPYAAVAGLAELVVRQLEAGADRKSLVEYFSDIIDTHALEAAPERHLRYARRLIASKVSIFEDVYKLICLLRELEAMKALGFKPQEQDEAHLHEEFSTWAGKQKGNLRETAKMLYEPWSRDHWYFRVLGIPND